MPEIIETIIYRLDELSGEAKEKARTWYREGAFDHDWFEFVYDDFERICAILGVTLETRKVSVERDSPTRQDMTDDAEDTVTEALRDLARWLYRQLEREYDHLTSDDAVDEAIVANGYTFTEAGRRFG